MAAVASSIASWLCNADGLAWDAVKLEAMAFLSSSMGTRRLNTRVQFRGRQQQAGAGGANGDDCLRSQRLALRVSGKVQQRGLRVTITNSEFWAALDKVKYTGQAWTKVIGCSKALFPLGPSPRRVHPQ
ncbi:hypothetical protein LY76DRAFT_600193 [Colletotrichum caudatum]|nr:hypothetical protein LY76DRAFT_600193 [Colletotrichum caudatum]